MSGVEGLSMTLLLYGTNNNYCEGSSQLSGRVAIILRFCFTII
jgi:hypothetical protein